MRIPGNKVFFWLTITGFIILVIGLLFAFIFFDLIIDDLIYRNVRLKEGTEQYERWEELPLEVYYKVNMFNITNSEDVANGAKPVVQEIGPYVYRQTRRKQNITYNEDEDTLTYLQYTHFEFDSELSSPYMESDVITMINVVQNTVFQILNNLLSTYLPSSVVGLLLPMIEEEMWAQFFDDTDTVFHNVQVGDILFNGYKFCKPGRVEEVTETICALLKVLGLSILSAEADGSVSFAFFKGKQDQHDGWYVVDAGIKNVNNLGLIYSWEGRTQMDTWNGLMSKCNKVTGRDSTIYPPYIKEGESFDIFTSTDNCRAAEIYYVGEDEVKEITGQRRLLRDDYFNNTEENECFCMESTFDLYGSQNCLPDGFFDLQACLGAPIIASFPHFLYGDEEYSSTVVGLDPKSEDHQTYVILEPRTGTPLEGFKRLQFNTLVRSISGIDRTKNLPNAVMPILWVEEGVQISDDYVDELQTRFMTPLKIVNIIKWIIVGIGAGMFVVFGILYFIYFKK